MRHVVRLIPAACLALALPAAVAAEGEWLPTLEKGVDAAKRSGNAVFVLTVWKDGVCDACDRWQDTVRKDAGVAKALRRFEAVEWRYDGAGGSVIKWTLANGGKSTDPSAQCFVVGTDGKVRSRLEDEKAYTPAAVASWLRTEADRWEREHPRTAIPFVPATVTVAGEGTTRTASCAEVDAAREAKRPALLYFGLDGEPAEKPLRAEAAASRKMEKGLLDSKMAAEAAQGWTLLRFDLADDAHRAFAATLGVEHAPALLVWEASAEKPARLPAATMAPDLAFRLRKGAPAKDAPK